MLKETSKLELSLHERVDLFLNM